MRSPKRIVKWPGGKVRPVTGNAVEEKPSWLGLVRRGLGYAQAALSLSGSLQNLPRPLFMHYSQCGSAWQARHQMGGMIRESRQWVLLIWRCRLRKSDILHINAVILGPTYALSCNLSRFPVKHWDLPSSSCLNKLVWSYQWKGKWECEQKFEVGGPIPIPRKVPRDYIR